ncbi:MAG TPA: zinc-binding dehydrogenase, partial [Xanthobacteraceae bacterium]|nr:zinc-binding dehydrogenase [Xanthobacteraceae bacterium]
MKAAVLGENGIEIRDLPMPAPAPNEVLVRVRASSLNRADLLVASGVQHGSVGGVGARIGLECSGEVEAVGGNVQGFKPGDRVMGSAPGGFAEYAVTDAARLHRIPGNNMTYEQAACFPVALQTMHNAIVTAGRLKRGETLLIQGASSGVGLMGMQIGKLMGASLVMGTSTNAQRRARLKECGCDLAIDTGDPKWPEEVKKATGGKGVNLIVDLVSGGVANQNLEAAALLGRIVNVGRLGGTHGDFNFDLHALKRIDYIGVTFRTRTLDEVREIVRLM